MISAAFTSEIKKLTPIIAVAILGLALRLYKITEAFPFDHDQEIPAQAAYEFFVNHKLSLIGQELSFLGFFLGPIHNLIQFIPYGVCNLKPDCVPYFYTIIGTLTIVLLYIVLKRIFDKKTAVIASAIYAISFAAISFERGVNSNFFLFLTSVGLLYSVHRYYLGHNSSLILGSFLAGIATVNFNPVFIFSTIAYFTAALLRDRRNPVLFIASICVFLINYFPLIIFNFRHKNILWENFLSFTHQGQIPVNYLEKVLFIIKNIVIPFISNYLFHAASLFFVLFALFLITFGIYTGFKKRYSQIILVLLIWIVTPIIGFTFYGGHIPDYYFLQSVLPMIVLVSIAVRKTPIIFLIFVIVFLLMNIQKAATFNSTVHYKAKKEVVNFIFHDTEASTFNVYYDFPAGLNTGYSYLFKEAGRNPIEGGQNLYILELSDPTKFRRYKYQIAFPNKKVNIKVIGFVHVVSVK